jgi:RNA polymerase sigma factor (sigma-70 family)
MSADDPAREKQRAPTDDEQLKQRRDLRARCDELFREHNDAIVRAVYSRLHSWEEATEVVQEAYVRVFRLDDPPPINFLRAYLYKTAFNLAADRTREQAVRKRDLHLVHVEAERDTPTPERLCLDDEVRACLQEAVNGLPPKCRLAYTLVELEDQTVREAAAQMGIAEMAVYQLVNRAYGHLARTLSERGWRK